MIYGIKTSEIWAATFIQSDAGNANSDHTLFFHDCRTSLGNKELELICMLRTKLTVSY